MVGWLAGWLVLLKFYDDGLALNDIIIVVVVINCNAFLIMNVVCKKLHSVFC